MKRYFVILENVIVSDYLTITAPSVLATGSIINKDSTLYPQNVTIDDKEDYLVKEGESFCLKGNSVICLTEKTLISEKSLLVTIGKTLPFDTNDYVEIAESELLKRDDITLIVSEVYNNALQEQRIVNEQMELLKRKQQKEEEYTRMKQRIDQLQQQKIVLTNTLANTKRNAEELLIAQIEKQKQNALLEDELKQLKKESEERLRELETVRQKEVEISIKYSFTLAELESIKEQILQSTPLFDANEAKEVDADLKESLRKLEDEKQQMLDTIKELNETIEEYENEIVKELRINIEQLETNNKQLEENNRHAIETIHKLNEQYDQLNKQNKTLWEDFQRVNDRLQELNVENNHLNEHNLKLDELNEHLRKDFEKKEREYKEALRMKEHAISRLTDEVESLNKENLAAKAELDSLKNQTKDGLERLHEIYDELEAKYQELVRENKLITDGYNTIKEEKERLEIFKQDKEKFEGQFLSLKEKYDKINQDNLKLKDEVEQLKKDKEEITTALNTNLRQFNHAKERLSEENERYKAHLKQTLQQLSESVKKQNEFAEQNSVLKEEVESVKKIHGMIQEEEQSVINGKQVIKELKSKIKNVVIYAPDPKKSNLVESNVSSIISLLQTLKETFERLEQVTVYGTSGNLST